MIIQLRKTHIYIGVITAIILILVAVTGVLLIHKKTLRLNEISVSIPGYATPTTSAEPWDVIITDDGVPIVAAKQGVFKEMKSHRWKMVLDTQVRKLYVHNGTIFACAKNGLYSSKDQGATWQQLFSKQEVIAMTIKEDSMYIATNQGIYKGLSSDLSQWSLVQSYPIKMPEIRAVAIKEDQIVTVAKEGVFLSQVQNTARLGKLSIQDKNSGKVELQKVIKDLHTGDFFGHYFYLVMDLMSVGILLVTLSGVYLWYKFYRLR